MDRNSPFVLKAYGSNLSYKTLIRFPIFLLFISLFSVIVRAVISIIPNDSVRYVLYEALSAFFIIGIIIFFLYVVLGFYSVTVEPERICVKWFGIKLFTINADKLKFFCITGNEYESYMCFSSVSVDDLSKIQEKRMLGNVFFRSDVEYSKKQKDRKSSFARDYIKHLKKSFFYPFYIRRIFTFELNPSFHCIVRRMFPDLPYYNFNETSSEFTSKYSFNIREDELISYGVEMSDINLTLKADGAHLSTKKKEITFIPSECIKTVVRFDDIRVNRIPSHWCLMLITCLSSSELAEKADLKFIGNIPDTIHDYNSIMATIEALKTVNRWTSREKNSFVMFYTENNLRKLKELYPHVEIINISSSWIYDSNSDDESSDS